VKSSLLVGNPLRSLAVIDSSVGRVSGVTQTRSRDSFAPNITWEASVRTSSSVQVRKYSAVITIGRWRVLLGGEEVSLDGGERYYSVVRKYLDGGEEVLLDGGEVSLDGGEYHSMVARKYHSMVASTTRWWRVPLGGGEEVLLVVARKYHSMVAILLGESITR